MDQLIGLPAPAHIVIVTHHAGEAELSYDVLLVPELESSNEGKLPMDKYYRFVVSGGLSFAADGALSLEGGGALFKQMPTTPTLTLGMHTLNSWMIGPEAALHDLDNIVLADLGKSSTLHAEWKLLHLLAQGSCASYVESTDELADAEVC